VLNTLSWSHHNPVRIVCAPLDTLGKHVTARHVLLVTTPGFVKRGVAERVKAILAPRRVTVWDGVKPNPDLKDLDAATQSLSALDIGCVMGLGGGSALDAAKVLATTIPSLTEPTLNRVFRHQVVPQWEQRLPLLAIPTTSGTGAEVTPFATVWDHEEHKKHSLAGDFVYPDMAFLDSTLTLTLGEQDTLYPALDAISHALESLWNKNCTPVSRAFPFQALALSTEALPLVMREPRNLKARQDLQHASVLAGLAISQTRTAIAHGISYDLTLKYGVPHGLACSFTLVSLLNKNLLTIARSESEFIILSKARKLLEGLNLLEKITRYADKSKILSSAPIDASRGSNYIGWPDSNVQQIITDAVTDARR
jgi:phosphonate metabolism-associated iron-containing alcohol dehydrogenase